MNDREKIIEISKKCRQDWRKSPANTSEDEMLADRLIEAGLGFKETIHAKDLVPGIHKVYEETQLTIWNAYYRDQYMALAIIDILESKGYPVTRWSEDNK